MKSLSELFRQIILANELDNNIKAALRFSDPDGVKSGKSGWSFGVSQFDTQNNDQALACLVDCGFTSDEIKGVVKQTINVVPLAARLIAHADVIERYDEAQLAHCITSALRTVTEKGILTDGKGGVLALADYVNQYGSLGPNMARWLLDADHSITAEDVLLWKLDHTKYGREHPADCRRRYTNLVKVLTEVTT